MATSSRLARIIARGAGLIAGSPTGSGRPGRVTVPTPSPALKLRPALKRRATHRRDDQCAMGDVRIVAGVLDDAGPGEIGPKLMGREGEFRPHAFRQRDGNRIGKLAGHSASKAARAAPAAQAPVVQPRLSGVPCSGSLMAHWPSAHS